MREFHFGRGASRMDRINRQTPGFAHRASRQTRYRWLARWWRCAERQEQVLVLGRLYWVCARLRARLTRSTRFSVGVICLVAETPALAKAWRGASCAHPASLAGYPLSQPRRMPPAQKRRRQQALTSGGVSTLLTASPVGESGAPILQVVELQRYALDAKWLHASREATRPALGDAYAYARVGYR